jgi:pimeloyl-ACP methyl ester carboxylesterase
MTDHHYLTTRDGARLFYDIHGTGDSLLVLHGFTLDHRMWDFQAEAFAEHYKVIRFDFRGFGKSDTPTSAYSHVEDLKFLFDRLEIDSAHIVALSMGGGLAVDLALSYPTLVRSLVLVDSVLGGFEWSEENKARDRSVFQKAREAGIDSGKQAWLAHDLFAPLMERPGAAELFRNIIAEYSGWHFVNHNPVVYPDPPAAKCLDEVKAPTLVIVGERDLPDFQRVAETLANEIAGAKLVRIAGAGHMSNMEDPSHFNQVVLDFLANIA